MTLNKIILASFFNVLLIFSPLSMFLQAQERLDKNRFQKQLLQFVDPVFKDSLVKDSLIASLVSADRFASESRLSAADDIAKLGASSMRLEHQARINEQLLRMQVFENEGFSIAGKNSLLSSAGYQARTLQLAAKAEFLNQKLEYEKELYRANQSRRAARLQNRIKTITSNPVNSVNAASGNNLNMLLESMRSNLLRYGYVVESDPKYRGLLKNLKLDTSDFEHIQLMLDVEGNPIVFTATEGLGSLGNPPFAMNHPSILPTMKEFEGKLENLRQQDISTNDFFTYMLDVSETLDKLDRVADEALGTAQESARKGTSQFRLWKLAEDYRTSLRGLVDRLQLEGSAKLLNSRNKYNPAVHGEGVLPLTTFIVSNGCKVAPARPGDEGVYAKLLTYVLQLQAIVED